MLSISYDTFLLNAMSFPFGRACKVTWNLASSRDMTTGRITVLQVVSMVAGYGVSAPVEQLVEPRDVSMSVPACKSGYPTTPGGVEVGIGDGIMSTPPGV